MTTRNFSLIGGILMLTMGCLALVPSFNGGFETLPGLNIDKSYGLFLNLFPMNIFNKVTLIIMGLAGMACFFSKAHSTHYSIIFSKVVFWVMGAAMILGLIPQTNTLSGHWPLFGHDIFLHGFFALAGGYFGYLSMRDTFSSHSRGMHKI